MYEPTQESLPTENGYAAWLLRLIHDSQEPCVCPGFGGHTNRDCPWYDLPPGPRWLRWPLTIARARERYGA